MADFFRPYGCKGPFSRFRPTGPAGDSRRGALWGCGICWAPGGAPAPLGCAPGPRKCVSLKPQCCSRVPVCGASGVLLGRNSENLRLSEAHSRSICAQKGAKKRFKWVSKRAPKHPKIDPKKSPKSPQNRSGGGLAPLWGANWARLAYLTRFGGQLEDSGARSGGGNGAKGGQKEAKGSPMGCQGEPKEAQKGAWSEGWAADGPCSASCRELWAGIRKTTKNLVFYRLRAAWRGAKWTLFGAPEELFRPTGSPLRARRGVLEASASAAGRFRAVFEPQWLREGVFEPQRGPIFPARRVPGECVASAWQSRVREIVE